MAIEVARHLRKSMTQQEVRLWSRLRALRQQGCHFRRQAPLEGYIVDFVCFRRRPVVEIDGSQHRSPTHAARDEVRDARLEDAGFRLLRIWNGDVNRDIDSVMQAIVAVLENPHPPR